ncbi:hypothetical protein THAOC_20298, partial [Thalassiosira oceanica]
MFPILLLGTLAILLRFVGRSPGSMNGAARRRRRRRRRRRPSSSSPSSSGRDPAVGRLGLGLRLLHLERLQARAAPPSR